MRISDSVPVLLKRTETTGLTDDEGLDVLGQCVLVCVLLDPETDAGLKQSVAKRIASPSQRRAKSEVLPDTTDVP